MLKCMGGYRIALCSALYMIGTAAGAVPVDGGASVLPEESAKSPPKVVTRKSCGMTILSDRVFFQRGRAEIQPVDISTLEIAADQIRADANVKRVRIEAHADRFERNGIELSRRRAANVMSFLIQHGVPPSVLVPSAFGARCLPFPSSDEDNRAKNRAVFLVVLERTGETLDTPRCRDAGSERGLVFKPC